MGRLNRDSPLRFAVVVLHLHICFSTHETDNKGKNSTMAYLWRHYHIYIGNMRCANRFGRKIYLLKTETRTRSSGNELYRIDDRFIFDNCWSRTCTSTYKLIAPSFMLTGLQLRKFIGMYFFSFFIEKHIWLLGHLITCCILL
ncbi:hypothetical protein KSS87_012378 [Heliosperma pusillum]|nr:hypothetical protein KSS87_012378 [Heliosperma pusillum]